MVHVYNSVADTAHSHLLLCLGGNLDGNDCKTKDSPFPVYLLLLTLKLLLCLGPFWPTAFLAIYAVNFCMT